ncbi:MAG TPA: M28 family metallopeptidase [Solirubrobacter sp.]
MLAALACIVVLGACGSSSAPQPVAQTPAPTAEQAAATPEATAATKVNRFDADRAWKTLEYQVKLCPRPAGSAKSKELAAYIKAHLPDSHIEAVPGGLQNVVGKIPGKGKPIVLAAHYDTKDIPNFVGANDGAGGTAQMLEIARVMKTMKRPKSASPIWFVAFDGEEATDDNDFLGTGVRGSKAFAKKYAKRIKELVLLDFVANKNLAIPYEQSSDASMWADLREAAERVGSDSAFPDTQQGTVEDDHTPFLQRGVPAIDLIDFNFPCWHKPCDDLTAVSKASLDKSGEAVLEFLRAR